MAEPTKKDTTRLGEKLIAIGSVLRDGATPAKANGHVESYTEPYWQTEQGRLTKLYFEALTSAVGQQLHRLEQEVAELKARPEMRYCGVWDEQAAYSPGAFVTDSGSLWYCKDTNINVRPGSSATTWQLAVKKGRDGRDAKGSK